MSLLLFQGKEEEIPAPEFIKNWEVRPFHPSFCRVCGIECELSLSALTMLIIYEIN